MGRLIDADKLKECILEDGRVTIDEHIIECKNIHEILVYILEKIESEVMRQIDLQPTAFNVEAVVEELEELKGQAFLTLANTDHAVFDFTYNQVLAYLDRAIEIIRKGGVK